MLNGGSCYLRFCLMKVFQDSQNGLRLHDMQRRTSNYVQVNDRKERGLTVDGGG